MLGFYPFASAPFASTGSGAIVKQQASFVGEAIVNANANARLVYQGRYSR